MVRLRASRDDLSLGLWFFDRNPFIFSLASLPSGVPGVCCNGYPPDNAVAQHAAILEPVFAPMRENASIDEAVTSCRRIHETW
ncbi:hypothetical protein AGROH133_03801 [Agrobacterium tumefaciens]|nr:hypothetical protein AGROH133_03801 [Agrobacterium tumefaciens]